MRLSTSYRKMSMDYSNKYAFEAEWYDKIACMLKKFHLYHYPSDNTVELVRMELDIKIELCIENKVFRISY